MAVTMLATRRPGTDRHTAIVESGRNRHCGGMVPTVEPDDSLLVARLAAGDDEALAEIWDRYAPVVYGHARRLTRDASIAEDVTQEVFVTLWQHPERFDAQRGSLRAYLGVHAHRRAIDAVRRDVRRTAREQRHHRLQADGGCGPEASADAAPVADAVRSAIERLPADQRQAVELAYFGGMTQREVATSLGIPEGTAKSRLRLAQAKLQSWLDSSLLEPV
jgi:RNA polymerase sigma-70 factor, ECF subfamily